ncbi:putative adipose-regulatory protein-domain-containing protein [Talaromyces proteolyticus]|uniref:Adipose-regulatory protein-domain-containing protein n=1 Tax=Talaromyces proteolyticus TaxID=1131652 RepID=A0AAD4KN39_9EURO|nr:putative adipose-regulatory protein-domain-containing protein [Talaromyces proteolyticus]KAH8695356.1 putative adipose-regulatory protein-domain-containing protein [Talaromyces proteolyticus]
MDEKEDFSGDEYEYEGSILSRVADVVTTPFRALISKEAQKAYLGTFLFLITSTLLFVIAFVAYWVFYFTYVPQIGLQSAVHLQFGDTNPWGTAIIGSELTALQEYDVSVSLHLPRTPENLAAGNFMLDLALIPPQEPTEGKNASNSLIARSRRPAILTYASPVVDMARKVSRMPLYLVGLQREEETLNIQMMERVEFARGWRNIPSNLRLEIHSREQMQVYDVQVKFKARFSGLRWFMYNWRILSCLVFTSMFWSMSMISSSVTWFLFSTFSKPKDHNDVTIKKEDEEGIDTKERTKKQGTKDEEDLIKEEEIEESTNIPPLSSDYTELTGFTSYQANVGLGTGLDRPPVQEVQRRRSHSQGHGDDDA